MLWPGYDALMACPPTCGAAAALLCSETSRSRTASTRDVAIAAQAMTTDLPTTFEETIDDQDGRLRHGQGRRASRSTRRPASAPTTSTSVELHDCFTQNELLSYEALGLVRRGRRREFLEDGDNTYGGKVVTNPSGGLLSKGHPLGATGLAQCAELVASCAAAPSAPGRRR